MTTARERARRRQRKRRSKLPLLVVLLLVTVAVVGVLTRHHTNSKAVAKNRALLAAKRARRRTRIANTPVTIRGPLPGALLIADRGNDRILLVDSHRRILWRFPTARDRRLGRQLVFDDDTFVEPGGKALISNEEDHQRHRLDRHPDARASRACTAHRASKAEARTSSTGPTTPTSCPTGR